MKPRWRQLLLDLFTDPDDAKDFFAEWLSDRPGVDLDAVSWRADRTQAMRGLVERLASAGYLKDDLVDALATAFPGQRSRIDELRTGAPRAEPTSPGRQDVMDAADPTTSGGLSDAPASPRRDPAIQVMISYAHVDDGGAKEARVLKLARTLADCGIHVELDLFVPPAGPPEGWPRWMNRAIRNSRWILCVCDETYRRRYEGEDQSPDRGAGVTWEGLLLTQVLYDAHSRNDRLIPVLFDDEPETSVPLSLRPFTRHRLPAQIEGLIRHITGQPAIRPPDVAPEVVRLSAREPAALPDTWAALGTGFRAGEPSSQGAPTQEGPPTGAKAAARSGPERHRVKEQLARLLLQLFGADELRRELSYRYGDVVTSELPGAPCSPAVLAGAVVDVLDTHGLIGDELFPWLREKRPFQTMKIDPVARAWADVGES